MDVLCAFIREAEENYVGMKHDKGDNGWCEVVRSKKSCHMPARAIYIG